MASNFPLERTAGSPSLAAAAQRYVGQTKNVLDEIENSSTLFGCGGLPAEAGWVARRTLNPLTLAVILLLLATSFTADAQPPGRVYRIGVILSGAPNEVEHLTKALDDGLRDLGYVEGRNVLFERRFAGGRLERLPALAAELVRLNVDVIVTGSNPVITAVKQATSTIPVVMAVSRDPVGSGFIANLARPAGISRG